VLAFNWLQSRNRRIDALMTDFSNNIVAYIGSNGAIKPAVTAAPAPKASAKPAAKPATTAGGATASMKK
jgi:biopolymer transport protein ExbB